jgi:sigma-B regulation protein RsbU (phosphoserine phosphatase)
VDSLYQATQRVQAGDLSFRVRVPHRDQLAALGESFNTMTASVSTLIEEQRRRQRLENELSIAHEVQQQLFPHSLPNLPGVELEAICRPARTVSGDYYDFIRISPTRLAIALADISGKGISAALLMANVQAALRSDVLRYRDDGSGNGHVQINTAEIVSHLNRHLFRNSSDERYATFFFGVYDTETKQLNYTNAGHLPPVYICGDRVHKLETGGMVVGLFNEVPFDQGIVKIEPGGILIAYSDGLIEPENVYGEEFGAERLIEAAMRSKDSSPRAIAQAMMRAAEEWSGSPEQADDMTVIVSRFSAISKEPNA